MDISSVGFSLSVCIYELPIGGWASLKILAKLVPRTNLKITLCIYFRPPGFPMRRAKKPKNAPKRARKLPKNLHARSEMRIKLKSRLNKKQPQPNKNYFRFVPSHTR